MALLYSADMKCRIYKVRTFDFDIRTQPAIVKLYDVDLQCITPKVELYDTIIYYVRQVESLSDPFNATKDDAASFFSVNEQTNGIIDSTYISSNLKVITPFSDALNRPMGRFDSSKAVSSINISSSGTDSYVALNFEDVEDFTNLEIVHDGLSCVIYGCPTIINVPSTHNDFTDVIDVNALKYYGSMPGLTLTQNHGSYAYCSFYYGILYIPNDATTYYFSFIASSKGYMLIDDVLFISQNTLESVTAATNSIQLTKGYHTFCIKHFASATSTNDMVRLQFKKEVGDSYVDFNVTNLAAVGVKLYTFPLYAKHLVAQGVDIGDIPIAIQNASLDSLNIKAYRPIIVLARKYSLLLQNEFDRIYYVRNPDTVLNSPLVSGTITSLYDGQDFPIAAGGVVLDCDRNVVLSPYITYLYNAPVKISKIELRDAPYYGDTIMNGKQCKSFTLSVVDHLKERMRATDLRAAIDLKASDNISEIQLVNNSDAYIRIVKKNTADHTNIIFTDYISVREVTLRDPVISSLHWGAVLTFKVYLKATEIVKLLDDKGEQSIINTTEDTRLVQVDYDNIGYIPSLFNHKNVPPDVQYGAEFIMFCLAIAGDVDAVETLGNAYVIENHDDHTIFNTDHLLNYRQLSQEDDRKFEVVSDMNKTTHYDFAYVGFSPIQDTVALIDFQAVTVEVTNTTGEVVSNQLYDMQLPNIGIGYTCVNQSAQSLPVVGIMSDNSMTSDSNVWDTTIVRVKIPILGVGATETLTFSLGSFSNTSLMVPGASWTPSQRVTAVWWDAGDAASMTLVGEKVSVINDKSGNLRHGLQGVDATRPYYDSVLKGLKATQDSRSLASTLPGIADGSQNAYTILQVVTPFENQGTIYAQDNNTTNFYNYAVAGAFNITCTVGGNTGSGSSYVSPILSVSGNAIALTEARYALAPMNISRSAAIGINTMGCVCIQRTSAAVFSSSVNFEVPVTATTGVVTLLSWTSINMPAWYTNTGDQFNGVLHESIVIFGTLTNDERYLIEGYLAWKWNMVAKLPVSHPYKEFPVAYTYSCIADLLQLPIISTKVPVIPASSKKNIYVLKTDTYPTPSPGNYDVPSQLTLATVAVTEMSGSSRQNIEIVVDISDIQHTFKCPFKVYDANTRTSLDTVGVNNDNSVTSAFSDWDGYRIRFRTPYLEGGMSKLFLIRVGNFQGDAATFVPSVQTGMLHNFHFSGTLVDSVSGLIGTDGGVVYNSDKLFQYYKAAQFVNGNSFARMAVTTPVNNFSISFWFITQTNSCGILCLTNTTTVPATVLDLKFAINSSGYLVLTILSGAQATLIATDKYYSDNQWHHVVLTSSSTLGMKLYIDKVQQASSSILSRTITTAYALLGWSDSYFVGSIDEFRVYNKCLSSNDVVTLNTIFDGTINDTEQVYQRTDIVHSPASRLTTLSDTSSLQGTPVCIYKYMDIDETIIRNIEV